MKDEFDVIINLDNIDKSYKDFEKAQHAIERGIKKGLDNLLKKLEDKLRENLFKYGLGGSKIASNINITDVGDGFVLSVGGSSSGYASFVEYGTGIIGSTNPHPKVPDDWEYDVNNHGMSGWWYPTTESDPNPTKTKTKNGNFIAFTRGIPSRPFMYDTWRWGRHEATRIVKRAINKELKECGF